MAVKDILTPEELKSDMETLNFSEIARKYGVSKQYINQIYTEYRTEFPLMFKEPVITKEWLQEQLRQHTILDICNMTGKSYHHIRKLMREYGLGKNTATENFDVQFIREQYVDQSKSDEYIAQHYGCSGSLVKKFRYKHSIFQSDRKPLCERLPKDKAIVLASEHGYTVAQLSDMVDETQREIIKLLESYGIGT